MLDDARILHLLEEVVETNRRPEEVCSDHPELLPEVKKRLRSIRSVEAQLNSLFPINLHEPVEPVRRERIQPAGFPVIEGYNVQEILGRGGMGVVYKAVQKKLNRPVALKTLLAGAYASETERTRFYREAEAVASLRHPHIVQVYDVGEVEGHPFYTMEFVPGGTLSQKVEGVPQDVRESADIIATLARTMHYAHQSGVVHRDLKPGNILVADQGLLKISDFGLALRLDGQSDLTMTGDRLGTPSYMAPEQVLGTRDSIGPAADIYSLGAMLYEMLTGHPPFRSETQLVAERRLMFEDPLPPSKINPKVPRDLATICLKCLHKQPRQRYESAGDLATDLDRFLRHEPIFARPTSRTERISRWVRRNPATSGLLVMALVLVGVLISEASQEWRLAAGRRAEKARLTARYESGVVLVQQGRYPEARAILGKLGDGGFADLRQKINDELSQLRLLEELEAIGVNRLSYLQFDYGGRYSRTDADKRYQAVFNKLNVGSILDDPAAVARQIAQRDIKEPLLAAFDDWAICTPDAKRRDWLLTVVRLADPDSTGWRDKARDPASWNDRATIESLAQSAFDAKNSIQLLCVLADRMESVTICSANFRQRLQQENSDDIFANMSLADLLRKKKPSESLRYYQAALAIRPTSTPICYSLGLALLSNQRTDESIVYFQRAIKIDPKFVLAYYHQGQSYYTLENYPEAIKNFEQALELDREFIPTYLSLGQAYLAINRHQDAQHIFTECLAKLADNDPQKPEIENQIARCKKIVQSQKGILDR